MPVEYAVIASGSAISADVDLRQRALRAIFCPVITSGDLMYVQGGVDSTSAGFMRLTNEAGALSFPTGAGSLCLLFPYAYPQPPYARFESAVAQAAPRTLTLITAPRR